jgi:hypothetical protein
VIATARAKLDTHREACSACRTRRRCATGSRLEWIVDDMVDEAITTTFGAHGPPSRLDALEGGPEWRHAVPLAVR